MASKFYGQFDVNLEILALLDVLLPYTTDCGPSWFVVAYHDELVYLAADYYSRSDAVHAISVFIREDYIHNEDYAYELWHLVAMPDWMRPQLYVNHIGAFVSFTDIRGVREYVRASLGDFSDDFDVAGIVDEVSILTDGRFYIRDCDYWAIVRAHDLRPFFEDLRRLGLSLVV